MAFCRSVKFECEFDGRKVKADLAPLPLGSLLSIQGARSAEDGGLRIAEALPGVVTFTEPPVDSDGAPVPIAEICTNAYFADLVGELGKALVAAAKPNPSMPGAPSGG